MNGEPWLSGLPAAIFIVWGILDMVRGVHSSRASREGPLRSEPRDFTGLLLVGFGVCWLLALFVVRRPTWLGPCVGLAGCVSVGCWMVLTIARRLR